jgi:putative transposase
MPKKDKLIKELIVETIGTSRKGRNQVIAQIQRKHQGISASKIRRVYTQAGFSLYKRLKKRRIDNPIMPLQIPVKKNEEWHMDFMTDSLSNGRRFRTFNVIDPHNRTCLCLAITHSFPASRVIIWLDQLLSELGAPKRIRTDNGPEFTSKLFQLWLRKNNIEWTPIEPGKPYQNGIVERFNRTYREEFLDAHIFESLIQTQELSAKWVTYFNHERPHMSLNYQTPKEYAA